MRTLLFAAALLFVACKPAAGPSPASVVVPAPIQAAVDASDRAADDRALDEGRHPAETLAFFGIAPGMKVGEIGAGDGYTTELLARIVGANGVVYAENPPEIAEKYFIKEWTARLAKPVNAHVVNAYQAPDAPFPPEAKDLDAVVCVLIYHDTYWLGTDRAKMNAAIFAALKSGGVFGIVDHSGRAGTGSTEVQTLHRIEEKTLIEDVEKAGFKLVAEADFLRHPEDARDWNVSPGAAGPRRGKSDRFVLKFQKH